MADDSESSPDPEARLAQVRGDLAQFTRVLDVQGGQFGWLIGAGASAMSGIPTAGALTLRFKHELYCAAHNLDVQEIDPADHRSRRLIEDYFDGRNGMPPIGDPAEYSVAFEKVYPSADVRADFIAELCSARTPNFGHLVLAALMATGRLRIVFTTNFDELIEMGANSLFEATSLTPRPSMVAADLGDPAKAARALEKETWPLVAKLHGDFRSVRLKNTVGELTTQDAAMRKVLRSACRRFGVVIAGYSGRDESVMAVLHESLAEEDTFPAGIYWCYRPTDPPHDGVLDLLIAARDAGRAVAAVPVSNFIELAGAVERAVSLPQAIRDCLASRRPPGVLTPVPLPSGPTDPYPILRLNALPLTRLPSHVRRLEESSPVDLGDAQRAIRSSRTRGLIARRSSGSLVALGHAGELATALAPLGVTVTDDLEPFDWTAPVIDPSDLGLLLDAVTLGLGRTEGLRHVLARRGHQVRVQDGAAKTLERLRSACKTLNGTVPKTTLPWAEAVGLTIERRNDSWWLLAVPEVWVPPTSRANDAAADAQQREVQDIVAEFIRERRATRYNRDVNAILDAWVRLLSAGRGPRQVRSWNLQDGDGIDPTFEVVGLTAYSRPFASRATNTAGAL